MVSSPLNSALPSFTGSSGYLLLLHQLLLSAGSTAGLASLALIAPRVASTTLTVMSGALQVVARAPSALAVPLLGSLGDCGLPLLFCK